MLYYCINCSKDNKLRILDIFFFYRIGSWLKKRWLVDTQVLHWRKSIKAHCHTRFQRAFTACCCIFQDITLASSQTNKINLKTQMHAVNERWKRVSQLSFIYTASQGNLRTKVNEIRRTHCLESPRLHSLNNITIVKEKGEQKTLIELFLNILSDLRLRLNLSKCWLFSSFHFCHFWCKPVFSQALKTKTAIPSQACPNRRYTRYEKNEPLWSMVKR